MKKYLDTSCSNLLVIKILTVLVSTISNSQVFLLKKITFFQQKYKRICHIE